MLKNTVSGMRRYRFHLLSLVHLPQRKAYCSCAFTQKNIKLAKMLMSLGHEVIFYGSEGSQVECTEFVQTHSIEDIRADYGDNDPFFEIGYDWTKTDFRHDFNSEHRPSTLKFYANCIAGVNERKRQDDFLLLTQGCYHKPIAEAVKLFLTVEPGVGYRGSYCNFRAFESSYIQNFTYGSEHPAQCIDGRHYDRVIPNYFDTDDVEFSVEKGDYYLFIGRMIKRKGIITAFLTCESLHQKLVLAGQGGIFKPDGSLTSAYDDFVLPPGHWEYIGFVNAERRKHLMARAIATFTPTEYLECFAGTHVESMLSGTPVITTDFGVFPSTVINGVNGFRCHTLQDFVEAAVRVRQLDPKIVRRSARKYLCDNVKWEFQKWFDDVYNVYESVVNPTKQGWHRLNETIPYMG